MMAKKKNPVVKKRGGWFSNMLSGTNGDISSKRFFGGIGLVVMHIIAVVSVILYPESYWMGELLITLTITDAGLLGVGIFEKVRPKRKIGEESHENHEDEEK